jgi:hypothetical protein
MDKTEARKEKSTAEMEKKVVEIEEKGIDVAKAENTLTPTAPGATTSFSPPVAILVVMMKAGKKKSLAEMKKK